MHSKNSLPVLSIVIPCFNQGIFLKDAIKSVEELEDNSFYEIIIVNDGSTDIYTIEILEELGLNGYYIIHQRNMGLSSARNSGIAIAKGKYILPLDADDKIRVSFIKKAIDIINNNNEVGIVYGDALHFEEENLLYKPGLFSLKKILIKNYINSCVIMRKEVWIQAKGYDINLTALEDWDMHLSAIELGWKLQYIPEIFFEYRIRNNSMSKTINNKQELFDYITKKHGKLYRKEFLKNITIKARLKGALLDLFKKITGNPQY